MLRLYWVFLDTAACWALYQEGVGHLTPVSVGQFWQTTSERTLPSWVPTESGEPITILEVSGLAVVTQDPLRRDVALGLIRWAGLGAEYGRSDACCGAGATRKPAVRHGPFAGKMRLCSMNCWRIACRRCLHPWTVRCAVLCKQG